jgi:hypothetical protein
MDPGVHQLAGAKLVLSFKPQAPRSGISASLQQASALQKHFFNSPFSMTEGRAKAPLSKK